MKDLKEMSKQVYEKIEGYIEQDHWLNGSRPMIVTEKAIRIGDVLEWFNKNKEGKKGFPMGDGTAGVSRFEAMALNISDKRPHLSQPIPLDPSEERRPLLEYLVGIIE